MKPVATTLTQKLTIVLVLKIIVMLALWWGFVRDQQVHVDADSAAGQLLWAAKAPAAPTTAGVDP